jgi:deferrochelatase/peroxidase EfeB
MNLRPGIDTPPTANFILAKLNLPFDDRERCVQVLRDVERVAREELDPGRTHNDRKVVADLGLNLLVAFGLRFFLGPLEGRGKEEVVQNFPPGGVFKPRAPTRFGMKDRHVPLYLRTMNADGDRVFVGRRLAKQLGRDPKPEEIDRAYQGWLSATESDLLLYIEANSVFLCSDLWRRLHQEVVGPHHLELACPLDEAFGRGDGRDLIGWHDPKSNMDDLIANNPQYYRSKIYLPHPAPYYPGEPMWNRDATYYDGGTYLVHRKYVQDLAKWNADDFTITDNYGRTFKGEEARNRAIGRDRATGKVIAGDNGRLLDPEPDATEANLAPLDSHILQVRGGYPAPFKGPFPPLKKGETNLFHIQDIRVRRRGGNWREIDPRTGEQRFGLHFVCFQNNIQQTGFEFLNNIWLLNPMFRLNHDHLLDPDKGIAEPVAGGYYFVPPAHREFAGEVFFG